MHTAEFVDSFTRGVLDEPRMKRIGFGEVTRSPVLIERTLSEVAGKCWDKLSHNRIKSGDRTHCPYDCSLACLLLKRTLGAQEVSNDICCFSLSALSVAGVVHAHTEGTEAVITISFGTFQHPIQAAGFH